MKQFTLLWLEWNEWNGFVFVLLGLDFGYYERNFEGELLGLAFSKDYLIFSILFFRFNVKNPIS